MNTGIISRFTPDQHRKTSLSLDTCRNLDTSMRREPGLLTNAVQQVFACLGPELVLVVKASLVLAALADEVLRSSLLKKCFSGFYEEMAWEMLKKLDVGVMP